MENKEDGQTSEPQEADLQDDDERGPGVLGRIRGAFGAAGEGVTGAVDTVTGAGFRKDFEDFTEVVTTTVVGVHRDQVALREQVSNLEAETQQGQSELRERLTRLEHGLNQGQAELRERLSRLEAGIHQGQAELREGISTPEQRSPLSGWVVVFGAASGLALVCSVAALIMSL